jgi:phage-related minor tail protein
MAAAFGGVSIADGANRAGSAVNDMGGTTIAGLGRVGASLEKISEEASKNAKEIGDYFSEVERSASRLHGTIIGGMEKVKERATSADRAIQLTENEIRALKQELDNDARSIQRAMRVRKLN